FYYGNLAAFSTKARNGARVRAGDVIGFMGNTGTAEGSSTHLHFEVHPVSLIYLGYDSAVDPTTYLESWRRIRNLPFAVATGSAPSPPGVARAPEPGAMLIGSTDIATGGLGGAKPATRARPARAPAPSPAGAAGAGRARAPARE